MISALLVLYAAAIVAWLLGRLIWGDQLLILALVNSLPALPFVLTPLALLLAALDRRPVTTVAALIPAILWLALFGWRFVPRSSAAGSEPRTLRVFTLNVLVSNRDIEAIAAAIAGEGPDIVALAELTTVQDAALAEAIGGAYPYRTLQRLPGASYGVGIYSRWPLTDLGSLQTGLGLRSAAADVETPDGRVRFVALHLRSTATSGGSLARLTRDMAESYRGREAQSAAICRYLDAWQAEDVPVVLAGDFNMSEFNGAYRCIGERLGDAFKEAGHGNGFTWPANTAEMDNPANLLARTRIDFVFHSRHWRTVIAEVVCSQTGSDHRALAATLTRTGP